MATVNACDSTNFLEKQLTDYRKTTDKTVYIVIGTTLVFSILACLTALTVPLIAHDGALNFRTFLNVLAVTEGSLIFLISVVSLPILLYRKKHQKELESELLVWQGIELEPSKTTNNLN